MSDYFPNNDEKSLVTEVNEKFGKWRTQRRPHEIQWFVNAAFVRGQQYVTWNDVEQRLIADNQQPSHRQRLTINRILPKVRARLAKFLKNRPIPVVVPATTDREDKQNAKATQSVLEYLWRKLRLEVKYRDAIMWAIETGKGYWWFHWNQDLSAPIRLDNEELGSSQILDVPQMGDVEIEVGSPFEVLVADPSVARIALQPEIMRVKIRPLKDVQARYGKGNGKHVVGETSYHEAFHYERRIAELTSKGVASVLEDTYKGSTAGEKDNKTHVLVKEFFRAPCPAYPNGQYVVIAGDVLLKKQDELPHGMGKTNHPYPCVEFNDMPTIGQYWGTTLVEQLIGLQKEYNLVRSKIAEQLRLMAFPKIIVAAQHQLQEGAWNSEAGEIIEVVALPGIPMPSMLTPPSIASDSWRSLDLMRAEFDDTTQLYPAAEGKTGGSTSGFQTNLLQEAVDSTHAPDVRSHELSIEEAAFKIRRIIKEGYNIPRLITVVGRNMTPDVFEFSKDHIDEHAEVVVQAGSGLPFSKAAKIQSVLDLWDRGVLGNPEDPEVRRRTMSLLEMGGLEEVYELQRRDEDEARLENSSIAEDKPVEEPQFFQDHQVHYQVHTDLLKSPEVMSWPEQRRMTLMAHTIQTVKFFDPMGAYQLSLEYGLEGIVPPPPPTPMGGPPPPGGQGGPPPPQGGAPPPQEGAPAPDGLPPIPENTRSIQDLM